MPIPVSSSLTQLNSELFFQEGFELSLDAIIPSVELMGRQMENLPTFIMGLILTLTVLNEVRQRWAK